MVTTRKSEYTKQDICAKKHRYQFSFSFVFDLEFITDAPDGGKTPLWMIFDFFTKTLDMYIYGSGIANIFISPDMIQKLFSGKYLIGRGCQEIEKFQFLWRHINLSAHVGDRIVGQIDRSDPGYYTHFSVGVIRLADGP